MVKASTPHQKRLLRDYLTKYDTLTLQMLTTLSAAFGKSASVDYVPHNRADQIQVQQFMRDQK